MFIRLPFRGLPRRPRKSFAAATNPHLKGLELARVAADELYNDQDIRDLWAADKTEEIMMACKEREAEIGNPRFTSAEMIYNTLQSRLKT